MEKMLVNIKDLSHRYSKDWAVQHININIIDHGVTGLLGSNGAGKSTTMNILCGVLSQTHGEVIIKGINVRDEPTKAKQLLGFLPQKAPIYPEVSVREYLTYCASLRKINEKDIPSAVQKVLCKCNIEHFADRLIGNLSGGYQQRVGIAQAIVHDPELVVLDEPTNGLDPLQVLEVRKLIAEIGKDRVVLLSTHILSEVQAVCDHIIMIEKGNLVFDGSMKAFNNYILPEYIVVKFNESILSDRLQEMDGVQNVENISDQEFRLKIDLNSNVKKKFIKACIDMDLGLEEIYTEKVSLDETFAKLSNQNIA